MSFVPYQEAEQIADRFLRLLADRGITPPTRSAVEQEFLSLTDLLNMWRNPERIRNLPHEAETIRRVAGIHDLAAKVLSAGNLSEFASFEDHLRMIASAKEFTSITQNTKADARDDISRKMAELYVGCLAIHCGDQVKLDHPQRSKGNNPDVMLSYEEQAWALAVKTLVSDRNGQTIFDNIQRAAEQIDASSADIGMVVINAKNIIKHDGFWNRPQPFADVAAATEALRGELRTLIDLASQDRPQSDWDQLFTGKAVPPVIFLGQSVTYLPVGGAFRTPTPLKAMITDACNREPHPVGARLACCLNHWMQVVLRGLPGPPPS